MREDGEWHDKKATSINHSFAIKYSYSDCLCTATIVS